MATIDPRIYKTGNEVPSSATQDLRDDTRILDVVLNDETGNDVLNRLGDGVLKTWYTIQQDVQTAIDGLSTTEITELNDLSDVDITGATEGQALTIQADGSVGAGDVNLSEVDTFKVTSNLEIPNSDTETVTNYSVNITSDGTYRYGYNNEWVHTVTSDEAGTLTTDFLYMNGELQSETLTASQTLNVPVDEEVYSTESTASFKIYPNSEGAPSIRIYFEGVWYETELVSTDYVDTTPPVFTSSPTVSVDNGSLAGSILYTAVTTDESEVTYSLIGDDALNFSINETDGSVTSFIDMEYLVQTSYSFTVVATDVNLNAATLDIDLSVVSSGQFYSPNYASFEYAQLDNEVSLTSGDTLSFWVKGFNDSTDYNHVLGSYTTDARIYHYGDGSRLKLIDDSGTGFTVNTDILSDGGDHLVQVYMNEDNVTFVIDADHDNLLIASGSFSGFTVDALGTRTTELSHLTYGSIYGVNLNDEAYWPLQSLEAEYDGLDTIGSNNITFVGAPASISPSDLLEVTDVTGYDYSDTTVPVFTSEDSGTIVEGIGANQIVYTAVAVDVSDVTYSVSGVDASSFSINSQTGEVTLLDAPDYATKQSYDFTVEATDKASNVGSIDVTLSVGETVNVWIYDDPLTLTDTSRYGYVVGAGSTSGDITLSQGYTVSFVVTSSPSTADFQFNVGGESIRLSGEEAVGQYTFDVTSATDTIMIFQEFADNFGSSGVVIENIVVYSEEGTGSSGGDEYEVLNFDIEKLTTTYENNYLNDLPTRPDNDDSYWAFESNSWLIFYADMYRVTGDEVWITRATEFVDYLLDNTDIKRDERGEWSVTPLQQPYVDGNYYQAPYPYAINGEPIPGWSALDGVDTSETTANVRRAELLTDSQIIGAIAAVGDCILDFPTELAAYTTKATEYITYCKTVLDSHENSWVEDRSIDGTTPDNSAAVTTTVAGWYYYPNRTSGGDSTYGFTLPMNHLAGAMYAGMVMHKHGISSYYESRATTVMNFIRSSYCRSEVSGRYYWRYGFADTWDSQGSEDLNHGAIMLGQWFKFARENGYHGFEVDGFDVTEMTPYAESLYYAMTVVSPAAESFDGSGGVLPTHERADPAHMVWLAEYKDGLYDELISLTNDYAGTGNMTSSRLYRAYSSIYLYLQSQGLLT